MRYRPPRNKWGADFAEDYERNLEDIERDITGVQEQFNQVVIEGDSSVEAAQARVDAKNVAQPTLKARLDKDYNEVTAQLAEKAKYTNVDSFGAVGDGVADDTTEIQAAIDSLKTTGGVVQFTGGKIYKVTSPLVLYDNIALSAYNATIKLGAYEQHFIVNQCYLSTAEKTRNKNISILGGTLDASIFSGTGIKNLRCVFHHVDNLKIKDATLLSQSGKYMIALGDTTNVYINNLHYDCQSDGVHLLGKNYNTIIENISGNAGDDIVAITTEDYVTYKYEEGDVEGLTIKNVRGSNATRIILLGNTKYTIKNVEIDNVKQLGTGAVINVGDGGELADISAFIDKVIIRNASSDNTNSQILLRHSNMGEFFLENINCGIYLSRETNGNVGINKLTVKNSSGSIVTESYATRMTEVYLENLSKGASLAGEKEKVCIKNMKATGLTSIVVLNGNTKQVTFDGCKLNTTNKGEDPIIVYSGVVDDIKFFNCNIKGGGNSSNCVLLDGKSTGTSSYCKRVTFDSCEVGDHKLIYRSAYNGTDVNTELILSNTTITATNRLVENLANYNLVLKFNNLTVTSALNELFRFTTGKKLTVYGRGWVGFSATIVGTLTVDCFSQDFPANASLLTKVAKGACYNTNSALSCGIGYLVSDGTSWKNLFSGATY